jgi:hypothetical protein
MIKLLYLLLITNSYVYICIYPIVPILCIYIYNILWFIVRIWYYQWGCSSFFQWISHRRPEFIHHPIGVVCRVNSWIPGLVNKEKANEAMAQSKVRGFSQLHSMVDLSSLLCNSLPEGKSSSSIPMKSPVNLQYCVYECIYIYTHTIYTCTNIVCIIYIYVYIYIFYD